jgi:hypothetical protein
MNEETEDDPFENGRFETQHPWPPGRLVQPATESGPKRSLLSREQPKETQEACSEGGTGGERPHRELEPLRRAARSELTTGALDGEEPGNAEPQADRTPKRIEAETHRPWQREEQGRSE